MRRHPQTVAIIGAGRVGRALARVLRGRGWRIGAVVTRSQRTARAAAKTIGAGSARSRIETTSLDADVVLITTPDREIGKVARELAGKRRDQQQIPRATSFARSPRAPLRNDNLQPLSKNVILHTNGALDRTVLAPLARLGAATGSIHPLQTFSNRAVPNLKGCICAIEGTAVALRVARQICSDMGCIPVVVAPEAKPAYHAAGVLAAGHVLAMEEAATRILIDIGFSRGEAVRALLPLTRQTLENFQKFGAHAAWTGPLARGDFATVRKHKRALGKFPREYREAYEAISRLALLVLRKASGPARKRRLQK